MSKCCVVQLPAMGKCCDPHSFTGDREFTVKVKVHCGEGDEGCRIEFAHDNCCGEEQGGGAPKK